MEINNWYMIKIDENSNQMIFKLEQSKKSSQILDIFALIGGFSFTLWLIHGFFIYPFNSKMYLKSVVEDTYLAKKTNSLMGIIAV
jgi:uncharacterized protein with PQ loop repeat